MKGRYVVVKRRKSKSNSSKNKSSRTLEKVFEFLPTSTGWTKLFTDKTFHSNERWLKALSDSCFVISSRHAAGDCAETSEKHTERAIACESRTNPRLRVSAFSFRSRLWLETSNAPWRKTHVCLEVSGPGPDSGYEVPKPRIEAGARDFDRNFEKGISSGRDVRRSARTVLVADSLDSLRRTQLARGSTEEHGQVEPDPVVVAVTVSE
ncbi:hypothetical protein K0M31_000824 [Melipona bicolor]|uniref:Uncharacterized protein n=1 Tax=Melipona bicolor TaxID=60889 RepID=A0AA40GEH9_9HYME|nr:hypothetical protein K0M31_000824 [Melipona bicolor]